jgi:hypothetical protein
MSFNMMGRNTAKVKVKPKREAAPVAPKRAEIKQQSTLRPTHPEHVEAMNRVKRLTMPTDGHSGHDTQMSYVHDVMNHGVNAVEDRGDVSQDVTARMYGKLHKASLHLNEHMNAHGKGDYGTAASHLELAGKELSEVGSTLSGHLGTDVTHKGDRQTYPISFMKLHATTLANHYRTSVAGITAPTAQVTGRDYKSKDTYQLLPNNADAGWAQEYAKRRKKGEKNPQVDMNKTYAYNRSRADADQAASSLGRMFKETSSSQRPLTPQQQAAGPTNSPLRRETSLAEQKLATMSPEMTRKDHVLQAHSDLMNKGKIHSRQLNALSTADVDRLHEITGVSKPKTFKKTGMSATPMPRDREL